MVVLGLLLAMRGTAVAGLLDPLAFPSLGVFPTTPGNYTLLSNSSFAVLFGPGGTFIGEHYQDTPGHYLSVFDFDSINLVSGVNILPFNSPVTMPVVLLSRGDATISGTLDVSAGVGSPSIMGGGGLGGYPGGDPNSPFTYTGPGGGYVGNVGAMHGELLALSGGGGGFGGPGMYGSGV